MANVSQKSKNGEKVFHLLEGNIYSVRAVPPHLFSVNSPPDLLAVFTSLLSRKCLSLLCYAPFCSHLYPRGKKYPSVLCKSVTFKTSHTNQFASLLKAGGGWSDMFALIWFWEVKVDVKVRHPDPKKRSRSNRRKTEHVKVDEDNRLQRHWTGNYAQQYPLIYYCMLHNGV